MAEQKNANFENSEERLRKYGEKLRQQNFATKLNQKDVQNYSKESDSFQLI